MYYHINKDINFGPKFVEHIYKPAPENWSGIWKKTGHGTKNSPTTLEYLCKSCKENMKQRTQLGKYCKAP